MSCGDGTDVVEGETKAQAVMPKRRAVRRVEKGICQRCREAKSKFIIRSATYCTACFETTVFSRFTRELYPPLHPADNSKRPAQRNLYRPPRLTSNVGIALSGGAGSMAMMDMLLRGGFVGTGEDKLADITKGEKDVVWQKGYVVYVEFAGVVDGAKDQTEWVKETVQAKGLEFVGLRAEDVFDEGLSERLGGDSLTVDAKGVDLKDPALPIMPQASSSLSPLEKLRNLIFSLPAPSRPALLSNILTSLLQTATSALPDISHLLVGETATRQSQRVISATASGRGWALPLELSGSLRLPNGVLRMSPMKELSLKEASFTCRVQKLETRNWRGWGKIGAGEGEKRDARGKGGAMSIEGLVEQFIASLDVSHPATVSTINRTGVKLVFPGGPTRDKLCPFCQMPVDPSAIGWKARTGLTSLSKTPADEAEPTSKEDDHIQLAPQLCYACLTTLTPAINRRDTSQDAVELPIWMSERVQVGREEMKAGLKGFLLDEDA